MSPVHKSLQQKEYFGFAEEPPAGAGVAAARGALAPQSLRSARTASTSASAVMPKCL